MSYIKRSSEWTKWKSKKLQWPQVGKRSYFGWSVIQFSSWGLIQPLDLESPHSEHKECIKLLRTFGWRGVRSLFYLTCGKNLTPKRLSKDPLSVLITSLLCAGLDSACPSHHLCPPAQWGGGLLWNYCGFGTVVQMGRALLLLPSMCDSLALLRDGNSHFTGSPFNTPQNWSSCLARIHLCSVHAPGFEI